MGKWLFTLLKTIGNVENPLKKKDENDRDLAIKHSCTQQWFIEPSTKAMIRETNAPA